MSEYCEKKCRSQFPKAQGEVFKLLVLSKTPKITQDKERQQILNTEKLELDNVLHFCLKHYKTVIDQFSDDRLIGLALQTPYLHCSPPTSHLVNCHFLLTFASSLSLLCVFAVKCLIV